MRMRTKPWARPELDACPYYVKEPREWKGKWHSWFPKKQPLHVELGCGKGMFTAELAFQNPAINYLAIDISSDVLGVARRNVQKRYDEGGREVDNLALLIHDIERILLMMDENDGVQRLYINFCNPWPKGKHQKKRLTHTNQLERYKVFLADGAEIHFKTDDDGLFLSTLRYCKESGLEVLWQTKDLHNAADSPQCSITSEHEDRFTQEGIPIKALVARYRKPLTSEG